MTKRQRFFSRPSRRAFRHRPRVLLDWNDELKKRRVVQDLTRQDTDRQDTDRMGEGVSGGKDPTGWSAEQLERIWQHTTG